MKTIAITIENDILERVDRLASQDDSSRGNRSRVIRMAIREYVTRVEGIAEDEREGALVRKNRVRLAKQAKALVREQAKP
jgi:metal-responsive CopG/Arc/MetJ family transcriptional regulator